MLRAESASPPPMGVPVSSWRGACAQVVGVVVAAPHTPDPVRADAVATSAIRVRISTGSSPLHSDARGTHHFFSFSSFFVLFFPLSFLIFCQRTLNKRLAPAHTDTHIHVINKHKRSAARRDRRTSTIARHRTGVQSRYSTVCIHRLHYSKIISYTSARARVWSATPTAAADAIVRLTTTGRSSPRTRRRRNRVCRPAGPGRRAISNHVLLHVPGGTARSRRATAATVADLLRALLLARRRLHHCRRHSHSHSRRIPPRISAPASAAATVASVSVSRRRDAATQDAARRWPAVPLAGQQHVSPPAAAAASATGAPAVRGIRHDGTTDGHHRHAGSGRRAGRRGNGECVDDAAARLYYNNDII